MGYEGWERSYRMARRGWLKGGDAQRRGCWGAVTRKEWVEGADKGRVGAWEKGAQVHVRLQKNRVCGCVKGE